MSTKLTDNPDIPVLKKWISLTEAAEILKVSRQYVNKKAAGGGYKTLHRLGSAPAFVVERAEIETILSQKTAEEAPEAPSAVEDETHEEIFAADVPTLPEDEERKLKFSDL